MKLHVDSDTNTLRSSIKQSPWRTFISKELGYSAVTTGTEVDKETMVEWVHSADGFFTMISLIIPHFSSSLEKGGWGVYIILMGLYQATYVL